MAGAILAGAVLIVFWDAFARGRCFFQRDIQTYWYPQIEAFVRAIADGSLPLWNPYMAFGGPLFADPSVALAYPLTWLNLVLVPASYYKVFVGFHCLLTGAGAYVFCLRHGLSRLASLTAAMVWTCSGPLLSSVSLFHHFAGACWIPWVLLALRRLLQGIGGSVPVLALAVAGQALAGSADMCLFTGVLAAGYALSFGLGRNRFANLGKGLAAFCLAVILAAVQWLPTLALLGGTGSRLHMNAATNTYWSMHPLSLVDLVIPRLFADLPMSAELRTAIFESREPLLVSLYLGAPAAVLVILGSSRRACPLRRFAAMGFLVSILGALGRHTPFYELLLKVPGISIIRYPTKWVIPAALMWALLAGLGVQSWTRPWTANDRRRAVLIGSGLLILSTFTIGAVIWAESHPDRFGPLLIVDSPDASLVDAASRVNRAAVAMGIAATLMLFRAAAPSVSGWTVLSLVAIVVGDLIWAGRGTNPTAPPELMRRQPSLLGKLNEQSDSPRIYVVPQSSTELNQQLVRGPGSWDPEWTWAVGIQDILRPPIGARWRIYGSYDGDFTGMAPVQLSRLGGLVKASWRSRLGSKLLRVAGVSHVISLEDESSAGLEPVAQASSVFIRPIRLLRVPDPLPRTYAVAKWRCIGEPASYSLLADSTFDPKLETILDRPSPLPDGEPGEAGVSRIMWRRLDAVGIEADLERPGLVVVLEAFDSGWKATVDGVPADLFRANVLFRAVPVPAGRHRVEMRYRPRSVAWGAACTAAGTLILALCWVRGPRATGARPARPLFG